MDGGPIDRLTEKQRACLRLVQQHYTSKQIARELGIGVDAVDQRIKCAMKTLGVTRRAEAARIIARIEPPTDYQHQEKRTVGFANRLRTLWIKSRQPYFGSRRSRFVFWCCVAGFIFGYLEAGAPLDDLLRDWNNSTRRHPASGDITVVAIDQRTLEYVGMRWTRLQDAELVQQLDRMGAKRLALASLLEYESTSDGDRALAAELQRLTPPPILVAAEEITDTGRHIPHLPLPEFRRRAILANPGVMTRLWAVRELPFAVSVGGRRYQSLAAELAGWTVDDAPSPAAEWASALTYSPYDPRLMVDFSIDPRTVPTVSAINVLRRDVDVSRIYGKNVVIARTDAPDTSGIVTPGYGIIPAIYTHVLGAETLKAGSPLEVPWLYTFLPAFLMVLYCTKLRHARTSAVAIGTAIVGLALLPAILDRQMIFVQIATPLFLLGIVGAGFTSAFIRRDQWSTRRSSK